MSDYNSFDLPRFRDTPKKQKPPLAGRLWEAWKRFGMAVAKVNLYVLTFVIYWTVFAVTAVTATVLRRDWLEIKNHGKELWHPLPQHEETTDISRHCRQF